MLNPPIALTMALAYVFVGRDVFVANVAKVNAQQGNPAIPGMNELHMNRGGGAYTSVTGSLIASTSKSSADMMNSHVATAVADVNSDGFPDVFVHYDPDKGRTIPTILLNDGERFTVDEKSRSVFEGLGFKAATCACFGDYDADGVSGHASHACQPRMPASSSGADLGEAERNVCVPSSVRPACSPLS